MKCKIASASMTIMVVLLLGCGSGGNQRNEPGVHRTIPGTGTESLGPQADDVITIAQKMSRSLIAIPELESKREKKIPRVVLGEIKNETSFRINKQLFLDRIRVELNNNCRDKIKFFAQEWVKDIKDADYVLTGKIAGISRASNEKRSEYILYTFQLINTKNGELVWEDKYETEREGVEKYIYQ
jgi:hypothetical protein